MTMTSPSATRVADLRLTLPSAARTAVVVDVPSWRLALEEAGIEIVSAPDPDLCVAATAAAALAAAPGAKQVVVLDGRGARALRREGFGVARLLSWGARGQPPRLIVRVDHRRAVRHALGCVLSAPTRWRRARNRVIAALVTHGARVPGRVVVAAWRDEGTPFPLRAVPETARGAEWCLVLGQGDALQRAVFLVFDGEGAAPTLAVKVARVAGPVGADAMVRDRRALELVHEAAPLAASRVPRLLGTAEAAGHAVSVETAAVGRPLNHLLVEGTAPAGRLRVVESIAEWVLSLAEETRTDGAIEGELVRIGREVIPRWHDVGASERLLEGLDAVPAVLQHNDLGSWNILATEHEFVVADWESAAPAGLPLWDLLYFLADALVLLDGARPVGHRVDATLALFRGDHPESPRLFRWVHEGAERSAVPLALVGSVVTLAWLHHALSHHDRSAALARGGTPSGSHAMPSRLGTIPRLAGPWMADPRLGPGWQPGTAQRR
jgi:hypothetical protein